MKKFTVHSSQFRIIGLLFFALCLLNFAFVGPADALLTAKANHDHITIDFSYHGGTVGIKGVSDAGVDLAIKVASAEGEQVLKKKGKVGGVLWMNVGHLTFENTPNFYAVYSTKKLDEMLSRNEQEKYTIGYSALARHVKVEPVADEKEKAALFDEFVKYKEASRLYAASSGKISTTTLANGGQEYYIMTDWPYQASPGEYLVTVYAAKNGKVVEQAETRINVDQVGGVKALASMAKDTAAFYGILSVGVALTAGFGVGLVFRKGGGSH